MSAQRPTLNEPFGRQAEPVTVSILGEPIDVEYWQRELERRAGFKGDLVQRIEVGTFKIYPRANND